jgi:histone-lysine N-methyltransferase SETMAR
MPVQTINAAAYQETVKRLKEAIWRKRPGLFTEGLEFFFCTTSWGWEILTHPPYSHDLALSDFHLFPEMKTTLEVSTSTPVKMFKIKSRNAYVPWTHFFYEGLDIDISLW